MSDDFTRHIFRLIVAKLAQQKGLASISESALDIFADAIIQRLSEYASSCASATARAGRTDTNGIDVFAGLARHDETASSLATFLREADPIPQFDYLVDAYPLPILPRFYAGFTAPPQVGTVIPPFRANLVIAPQEGNRHIPRFFPPFPKKYTFDHTVEPDPPIPDDPDIVKRREADQQRIKDSLRLLLSGRDSDKPNSLLFDCELAEPPQGEWLSMPTPLLEAPAGPLEGTRTRDDPEFLPLLDITESMVASDGSREVSYLLQHLSIRHTKPGDWGTLKDARHNPPAPVTAAERERLSSPPSSS
jgi:hypothetical protein